MYGASNMSSESKKPDDPRIIVVMPPDLVEDIDGERRQESHIPNRSEAIRMLLREAIATRRAARSKDKSASEK